jgi:hypothetical protein
MNRSYLLFFGLAALTLAGCPGSPPKAGPGSSGANATAKETLKVGFLPVT